MYGRVETPTPTIHMIHLCINFAHHEDEMSSQNSMASGVNDLMGNLIAYFIQRQRLVTLAMLDLHPLALRGGSDRILDVGVEPYIQAYRERQEELENVVSLQEGIWKSEWRYRVHGVGCKLVNIRTNEPIEWDAPNPDAFRFEWFWNHLLWRQKYESQDPYVRAYLKEDVSEDFDLEDKLVSDQLLVQQENGTYLLKK